MTIVVTLFVFYSSQWAGTEQLRMPEGMAARLPIVPLLTLQGIILFFMGTGAVASGMTAEEDEGVMDYQRLVPMSPISKLIGYLLGLPVREWLLFLLTLPFSMWCFWKGGISLQIFGELYSVVVSAALLYHMTALLAAMVMKNRRLAFLGSMILIFALYTAFPAARDVGLVAFSYVTITPTVEQLLPELTGLREAQSLDPGMARFFGLVMPQARFSLICQGAYLVIMGTMVCRRWQIPDCQLLGKIGALVSFVWMQAVLLGTSLPLIESGRIFALGRRFAGSALDGTSRSTSALGGEVVDGASIIGIYGMITLVLLWVWTSMVAPSPLIQRKGWQRAAKLGQARLPYFSDAAGAAFVVGPFAVMGAGAWWYFANALYSSKWFPDTSMPGESPFAMLLVSCTGGFLIQQLTEKKGRKSAVGFLSGLMILPLMAVIMMFLAGQMTGLIAWILALSPIVWPFYVTMASLGNAQELGSEWWPLWLAQAGLLFWWFRLFRSSRSQPED
jgi:hypothetical protein